MDKPGEYITLGWDNSILINIVDNTKCAILGSLQIQPAQLVMYVWFMLYAIPRTHMSFDVVGPDEIPSCS